MLPLPNPCVRMCTCLHNPVCNCTFVASDLPCCSVVSVVHVPFFNSRVSPGNWLKRSSLSGLTDGVEDLLDISSVDRLSFIRQSSKVSRLSDTSAWQENSRLRPWLWLKLRVRVSQVKFTSAVKLSEGGAAGPEYGRDEEENFFKRLGKWRSGRRNPSKLHHTEEKDGRPPPRPRGAPLPTHAPSPSVDSPLSLCPRLCLSVCCRVLSRPASRGLFPSASSPVRPFSMSAPPDSCAPLCQPECIILHPSVSRL